jgi:hypothetical protein
MTEQETAGRVKHPADCPCRVCKGVRTADARRQAEAEQEATYQAVARALVKLMARGSLSGPDVLRNLVGHDDALRILRAAGMNPGQVAASWQAASPVQQAQSTGRTAALWASSPDHDPRMVAALTRPGVTDAEIAAVRAQVAEEYRARSIQQAARRQSSGVMWRTRDGSVVTDGTAPPVQASRVNQAVPPLGSEEV